MVCTENCRIWINALASPEPLAHYSISCATSCVPTQYNKNLSFNFRWNSSYYMITSFVDLKPAVVQTLSKLYDDIEVAFTEPEWTKMKQIKAVLKPLEEATKLLSKYDASISTVIPFVTAIIKDLECTPADHGVMTWKRALKKNIETRFSDIESNRHYAVATMLDSRYKHFFYRDANTFIDTKDYLVGKLIEYLEGPNPRQVNISHFY